MERGAGACLQAVDLYRFIWLQRSGCRGRAHVLLPTSPSSSRVYHVLSPGASGWTTFAKRKESDRSGV